MDSKSSRTKSVPMSAQAWEASLVEKERRRHHQQSQQIWVILAAIVVVAALIASAVAWSVLNQTEGPKTADCDTYPQYCVPLAGGSTLNTNLEAAAGRTLDKKSQGVPGVQRYIDADNVPTLGDPSAPIHFRVVSSFTCPHCNDYHTNELARFIDEFVLQGKATLGLVMVPGTPSEQGWLATQAALCAGEQGAFWELSDELYALARTQGVAAGLTMPNIRQTAAGMGLDADKLEECIESGRYGMVIDDYSRFAVAQGVIATPALLVKTDTDRDWSMPPLRCYATLQDLTWEANQE